MKVTLGKFSRAALEAVLGKEVLAGAQAALLHYARRLRSGLKPPEFPRFFREEPQQEATTLEVEVSAEVEERLEQEMQRQGVTLEQLTAHAVVVYLADLDRAVVEETPPKVTRLPRRQRQSTT